MLPPRAHAAAAALLIATAAGQTPVPLANGLRFAQWLPALAFDAARDRLVCVIGTGEIQEWDGAAWHRALVQFPPPGLNTTSGAFFDELRARLTAVVSTNGGWNAHDYDGHTIAVRGAAPGPGPFTFDAQRGLFVNVVNGPAGTTVVEWDGATWRQVTANGPPFCLPFSFAWDPGRRATLFLGWPRATWPAPATQETETWEWDGARWKRLAVARRLVGTLVYDHARQRMLALGGATWAWNGTGWIEVDATAVAAGAAQVAADPRRGVVYAYDTSRPDAIRRFDGASWSSLPTPHAERHDAAFTFDEWRGRAVVFGGNHGATMFANLREWDGVQWTPPSQGSGPRARRLHAQVFDSLRGETLVIGGYDATGAGGSHLADAWAWNGTNWRQLTSLPWGRSRAGVAYDAHRDRVLVLGGDGPGSTPWDHWEWNGAAWLAGPGPLPFLAPPVAGYDLARRRTVVCSGAATWEFDGGSWTQHASYLYPPPNLSWNPTAQRLEATMTSGLVARVWSWDGATWTPGPPGAGAIVHDAARDLRLFFHASLLSQSGPLLATVADFGSPCGAVAGLPNLTACGRPRLGSPIFHVDLRARAAVLPAALAYATSQAAVPLPGGCTLLLRDPVVPQVFVTDGNGFLHHPLPLPNAASLRGVALLLQAAVLDPTAAAGHAMTAGLRLTLGD